MAILNKEQLFDKVSEAITSNGWTIVSNSDKNQQPVRLEIEKNNERQFIRFYIWNLTHGGASRPENEYRIQVKVDRFDEEAHAKTLILGYWDEGEIFAGFDLSKHMGKPGWSASMQIKLENLKQAEAQGMSAYTKENGEIAVALKPSFFIIYLNNLEELHRIGDVSRFIETQTAEEETSIEDDTENEILPYRYSISSYGADYPVDAIVKRIEGDIIFIPPFQRNFVWNQKEASRFVESLILGLPVPGVFLSKEEETNRMLIIDGQQRLFSLYSFYMNNFKGKEFLLKDVQSDLEGKRYNDLSSSDKNRLDDSIIHATVVKQDGPDDNESSIYMIFERLNTGGRLLTAQEIRACVYYGDFNEYLNRIVNETSWREIFGKKNERLKEQEILLRFFALYYDLEIYQKPLKSFLNSFMKSNRNLERYNSQTLDNLILPGISFISASLGKLAFRLGRGVNAAVFDSMMIGLANRMERGTITNVDNFTDSYWDLISNEDYINLCKEGTSDDATLKGRIQMAIDKFNDVE